MIGKEPYFEDVIVGEEITPLVKLPFTTRQLVQYAGASGDFYEVHYDEGFAKANGLPTVIAHGLLKCGIAGQLVTDWAGVKGTVKKLGVSYRGMDPVGNAMTGRGRVTNKYVKDGENIVELEIWLENDKGQITTPGTATVALPSRS